MNSFYRLFKKILSIRSPRLRLMMLAAGKLVGSRFVGVYLDPVMACNIRCRMCYFSDPANRPAPLPPMTADDIARLRPLLRSALKLQIGCGAEPTLYPGLVTLISEGCRAGVPFIELTTNGQLLTADTLADYCRAGLSGITLSLHGTTAATYEYLMQGASFSRLCELIGTIGKVQKQFPGFQLRVNYTVNNLNRDELPGIWTLFGTTRIHTLQVRPIQRLGDTAYSDFTIADYPRFITDIIEPLHTRCRQLGTIALLPSADNIRLLTRANTLADDIIEEITYCHVTSRTCYRSDFDPARETISHYQRRTGITRRLYKAILSPSLAKATASVHTTKKLNYR